MEKKTRKNNPAFENAKKYVNQQLATMKEFDSAPKLSPKDYDALVRKVVDATK